MQESDEIFMERCLELAKQAFGATRSNPMVGAVIVCEGQIIAEGSHNHYGQAHAEVDALSKIANPQPLPKSTLYVNLEPCSHFGKTPPCADAIIKAGITRVVVGTKDPNPKVAGEGINRLVAAGIDVKVGVLEEKCRSLNQRFFTFHEKKRPWILLKWAQSKDGFFAKSRDAQTWISSEESKALTHKWRTEEMGILIGTRTALIDNPKLTARLFRGPNPLRIVLDRKLSLPNNLHIFDRSAQTLVVTEQSSNGLPAHIAYLKLPFDKNLLPSLCRELHQRNILSLMVEGGSNTLSHFLAQKLWDEARVFSAKDSFGNGVPAPELNLESSIQHAVSTDILNIFKNPNSDVK